MTNIPPKRNRKDPICFSPYLDRARNLIERFLNKIKQCRRPGKERYGLLPPSPRRFGGQVVASLAMTQLAHEVRQPSTRGKSLRIFRSHVKPANQKYSAFVLAQISRITSPVSRRMRGARERHERVVRCGGR